MKLKGTILSNLMHKRQVWTILKRYAGSMCQGATKGRPLSEENLAKDRKKALAGIMSQHGAAWIHETTMSVPCGSHGTRMSLANSHEGDTHVVAAQVR